jgi:outer membrane protein insertion porin family
MRLRLRQFWPVLFVLAFAPASVAQTRNSGAVPVAPNSLRLTEIRVVGSKRFETPVLVAALGLKLGATVSEDDLKAGAEQLGSSGMFSDVTYSYVSGPRGTHAEFKVSDTDGLVPAHFDNFVWLSRAELLTALQKRTPLFDGELPNAGDMYNRIAEDLKTLLREKSITADVSVMPQIPMGGGKITSFIYRVGGIKIPIRNVDFPGSSPDLTPVLGKAFAGEAAPDYSESQVRTLIRTDLLPVYLSKGYLHAGFKDPEVSLVDAATNAVAVRLPVEQGIQYVLDTVSWSGNTAYTSAQLAKSLKVQTNAPADQIQLREDLDAISKFYGTKGYLYAQLRFTPSFDDAAHKVQYAVTVSEGAQYHMGNVIFADASDSDSVKLRAKWRLGPGDVFDTSYATLYLQELSRTLSRPIRMETQQSIHEDTKTVDVILKFTR